MITGLSVSSVTVTPAGAHVLSWLMFMSGFTMLFIMAACSAIILHVVNHWKD